MTNPKPRTTAQRLARVEKALVDTATRQAAMTGPFVSEALGEIIADVKAAAFNAEAAQ
jgi:hypothetical protein